MVLISDIGEEDDALFCMTEYENCCKNPDGEFYYPDSSKVRIRASGDSLYRNRGDQLIRLNRRNGAISPRGRYRCDILDTTGKNTSVYINIASKLWYVCSQLN